MSSSSMLLDPLLARPDIFEMVEQIGKARGPAYNLRLEDVVNAELSAACLLCKHESRLDVPSLIVRWSQHERLVTIEDRLRCRECGAGRWACKLRVVWG